MFNCAWGVATEAAKTVTLLGGFLQTFSNEPTIPMSARQNNFHTMGDKDVQRCKYFKCPIHSKDKVDAQAPSFQPKPHERVYCSELVREDTKGNDFLSKTTNMLVSGIWIGANRRVREFGFKSDDTDPFVRTVVKKGLELKEESFVAPICPGSCTAQERRSTDQAAKTEGAVIDVKTTFSGSLRGSDPELDSFGKMAQVREAFKESKYRESTKCTCSVPIGWPWKETTNGTCFHLGPRCRGDSS